MPEIGRESYERRLPPVVLYKDDHRIAKHAHCDNVAVFLMRAGYRAVVPGREDFLYSADWLRAIALELMDPGEKKWIRNKEEKLNLLVGNLRAEGEKGCPLLFAEPAKKSGRVQETQCVASASGEKVPTAQDWVERLDLTLDGEDVADQIRRRARETVSIRRQLLMNEMSMTLNALADVTSPDEGAKGCVSDDDWKKLQELTAEKGYEIRGTQVAVKDDLVKAVVNLASQCTTGSDDAAKDGKTVMTELARVFNMGNAKNNPAKAQSASGAKPEDGQNVFFSSETREAQRRSLLRVIAREEKDIGYTFADLREGQEIVARRLLIGVIGRETMGAVSPTNLDMGKGKGKKTVTVLDPRRTVALLIRAASLIAKEGEDPHGVENIASHVVDNTIVMAQMPRTEAEELGAHLREDLRRLAGHGEKELSRVDLILSEAQLEHASPKVELAYGQDDMTPVLTPHPAFDAEVHGLAHPVSKAELWDEEEAHRTLSNSRRDTQVPSKGDTTTLALLERELGLGPDKPPALTVDDEKTGAIELVLRELQVSSHADVVVLERRDLYLDYVPVEYADYKVCDTPLTISLTKEEGRDWKRRCRLHVALDRILWTTRSG